MLFIFLRPLSQILDQTPSPYHTHPRIIAANSDCPRSPQNVNIVATHDESSKLSAERRRTDRDVVYAFFR
jgi:hypothetical protein